MNWRTSSFNFLAVLFIVSLQQVSVHAQTLSFTQTQVAEGKEFCDIHYASCHGVSLEGAAVIPSLSGASFNAKWSEAPLKNLAIELRQMPPGSQTLITENAYKSITASIMTFNGFAHSESAAAGGVDFESELKLPTFSGVVGVVRQSIAEGAAEIPSRFTTVSDAMLLNPPAEDWLIWQGMLDGIPSSTVITYAVDGTQYVAIVAEQTGYHDNDWSRMFSIFAEPEGMPFNNSPKRGAAIWVFASGQ